MSEKIYKTFTIKWLNRNNEISTAPFFYIYKKSKHYSEKITFLSLLQTYAHNYNCSLGEAEEDFYLEQKNYVFSKKADTVYVSIASKKHYHIIDINHLNKFCNAKTKMGQRCKQFKTENKMYCKQHIKSVKEENNLVSSKKLDGNNIPQLLLDEKDIEKLRDICITVYMNYRHEWSNIVSLSRKRMKNRKILSEINELESTKNEIDLKLDKLREALE